MLVSVIVPCFNQGQFLSTALDSVLAQTHHYWECIVVNDGSNDCTESIAARYASLDSRIRVVTQRNRGLAAARNVGLANASGRYVQFLDADDWIAREKLERQVSALKPHRDPAVAYCYFRFSEPMDINVLRTTGRDCPRFASNDLFYEIASRWERDLTIPIHCFLFDVRLFKSHGIGFDESLPNHEDWDCWLRLFQLRPPVELVDAHLAVYRLGIGSMARNTTMMWRGARLVCDKHLKQAQSDRRFHALFVQTRHSLYLNYRSRRSEEILGRLLGSAFRHYKARTPWPIQRYVGAVVGGIGLWR